MFISRNISLLTSLLMSSAVFSMPYGIGCVSDIDSDGIVGVGDVLSVIDAWGTSNEDADCNGDGFVNVIDLLAVIEGWGTSSGCDINGDGMIDIIDLLEIVGSWGPCS